MSSGTLYRLCGIALLGGGILAALGQLQDVSGSAASPAWIATGVLMLIGNLLEMLGLPALLTKQAQRAGWLGVIGFLLFVSSGVLLGVAVSFLTLILEPWMVSIPALSRSAGPPALTSVVIVTASIAVVGTLVFALATLRARVFPRWPALLLIICMVLNYVGGILGIGLLETITLGVFHLALAWFGFVLCFGAGGVQDSVSSPLPSSGASIQG